MTDAQDSQRSVSSIQAHAKYICEDELIVGGPPETRFPQKAGPRYWSELRYHESESKTGTDDGRTTVNQSHHNGDPPIPFGTPLGTNGVDPAWELDNRRRWRHMDP